MSCEYSAGYPSEDPGCCFEALRRERNQLSPTSCLFQCPTAYPTSYFPYVCKPHHTKNLTIDAFFSAAFFIHPGFRCGLLLYWAHFALPTYFQSLPQRMSRRNHHFIGCWEYLLKARLHWAHFALPTYFQSPPRRVSLEEYRYFIGCWEFSVVEEEEVFKLRLWTFRRELFVDEVFSQSHKYRPK